MQASYIIRATKMLEKTGFCLADSSKWMQFESTNLPPFRAPVQGPLLVGMIQGRRRQRSPGRTVPLAPSRMACLGGDKGAYVTGGTDTKTVLGRC